MKNGGRNIINLSLDELWEFAAESQEDRFDPARLAHHPEPVRRYFSHAIEPGTPLARAVRLQMSGEIKLEDWVPFEAEQVIVWDRGLIWKAKAKMPLGLSIKKMPLGLSIKGSDRLIDGEGAMRWKLFGVIPVVSEEGPDISRSAAGRMEVESIWLPAVLLDDDVQWTVVDDHCIRAHVRVAGDDNDVEFRIDDVGAVRQARVSRWGAPAPEEGFGHVDFGGILSSEGTFDGYTVPTSGRIGWFIGSERFESEGEFFRAEFRDFRYR